ncbi:gamma-glutamyltranspeptidase / glutathione hydrolase [Salinihabitans flavidus]|uniref:Gamma-glutamyltranspeptidase / glutathione hydrolase n=2 Tax=Salinihabitans flavidus TaxID=569882 RepID=A0A1H8URZ6_9RHOB|nr:gamma-glutamyltranspeptidase / glutathione hydrolase [Salinihabitans flavidus]
MTSDMINNSCAPDKGIVAAGSPFAAAAGAEVLKRGGNAADAAVATTLALAVADPANCSFFGRCQILWRGPDGEVHAIDGASATPAGVAPLSDPDDVREGFACAAIPGLPQALARLQAEHGRLTLSDVVAPAVRLAEKGFAPPAHLGAVWRQRLGELAAAGQAEDYVARGAQGPTAPALFRHPRLAALLHAFGAQGPSVITGSVAARRLAQGVCQRGGYWSAADLADSEARDGEVIRGRFRDCEVITLGRQGWGHSLIEMLSILDAFPRLGRVLTADEVRLLVLIVRTCFNDRPQLLGSLEPKPDGIPLEILISPGFIDSRVAAVRAEMARRPEAGVWPFVSAQRSDAREDQDTTHLSVIDGDGATVAMTGSIGPHFGMRVADPIHGVLMAKSYTMETKPVPGARDVTEMCPTIITRNGRLLMSLGAAGSERIPGAILQVIANVVDRGLSLREAVKFARVNLKDDVPRLDVHAGDGVIAGLKHHGILPEMNRGGHTNHLGIVQVAGISASGRFSGAADSSWDGAAIFA